MNNSSFRYYSLFVLIREKKLFLTFLYLFTPKFTVNLLLKSLTSTLGENYLIPFLLCSHFVQQLHSFK